jgi:hypothetical protein
MVPFVDWFPLAFVGVILTALGTLKVIGLFLGLGLWYLGRLAWLMVSR